MGLGRRGALLLLLLLCMSSPALASNSTCVLTTGADCVGHDLSNAKALTPQKCCDLCGATPGCLAFTHSLYDADGKPDPTCYLKSECSRTQPASTCTKGISDQEAAFNAAWGTCVCAAVISGYRVGLLQVVGPARPL